MTKTIVGIACCALITPLAMAKEAKQKNHTLAYIDQGVTVSGTVISTTEGGAAASYQPANTLVVMQDNPRDPSRYVLDGPGHVWNSKGEAIRSAIKPGARVRVFFANSGGIRTIDHVVVD